MRRRKERIKHNESTENTWLNDAMMTMALLVSLNLLIYFHKKYISINIYFKWIIIIIIILIIGFLSYYNEREREREKERDEDDRIEIEIFG